MLNLFRRKNKTQTNNPLQDKVAGAIVEKVTAFQVKWACYMQRNSERLSSKTKKIITALTVTVAATYSLYIVAYNVLHRPKKNYSVSKIHVPAYTTKTGEEKTMTKPIISTKEYNNIVRFHEFIDSLNHTERGRKIADSILKKRPGLMDSTNQLKQLYELQQSLKK